MPSAHPGTEFISI